MIVSSLLILFTAAVLLTIGIVSGSDRLLLTSIAASLAAAVALYFGVAARSRRRPAPERRPAADDTQELARIGFGDAPTTEIPVVRGRVFEPTDYQVDREPEVRFETPPRQNARGRHQSSDDMGDEPPEQRMSSVEAAGLRRLDAQVSVVDGRPRFHLAGCVHLVGRDPESLPVAEALDLGFGPCSLCEPASQLLVPQAAGR
ncbi:hypothetical protein [Glycomyces xiaoerkulensis]|uniref:hypothetical protein n=1 Tax=Glycomyces xiaoerkulensis TaxID=2038139 RepID=UPI0018E46AD4|nr:hypothetical protein [Glycomyces xiaoerkulensis]